MFGTIMHRMIFFELLKVFLLSLLAITGLLLLAGLVAEAQQRGLQPGQILGIIPLIIPSTLPYTLPATTLFATCVIYGRLAHDSEILAIKASGVSVLRVVSPAVFLGFCLSVITAGLYYWLIPTTHHMLKTQVISNVEEYLYGMLKQKGKIDMPNFDYVMYVKQVDGKRLLDSTFMRKDKSGKFSYDVIAKAEEAELKVDLEKKQVIVIMRHCYIQSGDGREKAYVDERDWPIDLPEEFFTDKKNRPGQMTWLELFAFADKLVVDCAETRQQIEELTKAGGDNEQHLKNLRWRLKHYEHTSRQTLTEMHKRPALAFGCLCFVMVGCPVGIWFSRSDYLSAFITCFLPIVIVYYPLTLCGLNIANGGRVAAPLSIWFADAVLGVAGLLLFRRLAKN